jgi:hypothetical protein
LLGLLFNDGGDMFLRNVGRISTDYKALYPRRQKSSQRPMWEPWIIQCPIPVDFLFPCSVAIILIPEYRRVAL